jgi:uncharacterized Zn-finger protein
MNVPSSSQPQWVPHHDIKQWNLILPPACGLPHPISVLPPGGPFPSPWPLPWRLSTAALRGSPSPTSPPPRGAPHHPLRRFPERTRALYPEGRPPQHVWSPPNLHELPSPSLSLRLDLLRSAFPSRHGVWRRLFHRGPSRRVGSSIFLGISDLTFLGIFQSGIWPSASSLG